MSNRRRYKPQSPRRSPSNDVLERVSAADRARFDAHPHAASYVRPALVGEFGDNVIPRGARVEVIQLEPGV